MEHTLTRGTATALGLAGVIALAPAPAPAQQGEARDCLALIETIDAHLTAGRDEAMTPNLSHLLEAARRFAAQGKEEECLEVARDAAGYLSRLADVPEVDQGGSSVVPDQRPPFPDDEAEGHPGVREAPGVETFAEPGFGDPEALEEAGLGDVAEELPGAGGDESGVLADPDREWRPATSPVAPTEPGLEPESPQPGATAALGDNPLFDLRADEIVGHPLVNNWGDEVGYIEDVVAAVGDPGDVYAVVSEDGESGIGGGEHLISLDRLRMAHERAVQWRVRNDGAGNVPELDDLPAYDPGAFSSLAREERTLGEVVGAAGR